MPKTSGGEEERNPCLGLRSIRLALRNLPIFRTQLRAALRASALGNVRLMFPLISTLLELRQAKMVLADVMEDLQEHHLAFNRHLPVGMMVETPAAAMMADRFVEEVDFLSIGTNDLIQYTLAVDRGNKEVVGLYTPADPAVLKLIAIALQAANRKNVPISMCGQMSGSPLYTMLLLGLGLRQFSLTPSAIPEVKNVIRSVSIPECEAVAARAMTLEHSRDVRNYLKEEVRKRVQDLAE
jgi:phosphotransferase system enzyme I (PtsI)